MFALTTHAMMTRISPNAISGMVGVKIFVEKQYKFMVTIVKYIVLCFDSYTWDAMYRLLATQSKCAHMCTATQIANQQNYLWTDTLVLSFYSYTIYRICNLEFIET